MKVAVRYYSRGGNVKLIAEALAKGADVEAISIDDPRAPLEDPIDILFIGGAIYRLKLDPLLVEYIEGIPDDYLRRVVCFGSSATTRRPIYSLQELFKKKGVQISRQAVYARNTPRPTALDAFEFFARQEVKRDLDEEPLPPIAYMIRAVKDEDRKKEERRKAEAEAERLGISIEEYLAMNEAERALETAAEQANVEAKKANEEAAALLAEAQEAAEKAAKLAAQAKEAEKAAEAATAAAAEAEAARDADAKAKAAAEEAEAALQEADGSPSEGTEAAADDSERSDGGSESE